jgi:TPP-dependent indolepyruvate ferredoxin oxidoreductase alpha subunit
METNETTVTNEQTDTQETTTQQTTEQVKTPTKQELLREMSKEYGVNLFDAEGLQSFKEYTEAQKTEQQKLQEQLAAYEQTTAELQSKQLEYQAQLEAVKLGISVDKVQDALKLADNDPTKLAEVLKKYPTFQSGKGVQIGVQNPNNNNQPTGNTEAEKYMAERAALNPQYAKYLRK